MRLKNRRNFWAKTVRLGAFLRPLGKKRCVFVGFGPKRTSGAKIIKIELGGAGGSYSKARPSLMDGLLNARHQHSLNKLANQTVWLLGSIGRLEPQSSSRRLLIDSSQSTFLPQLLRGHP